MKWICDKWIKYPHNFMTRDNPFMVLECAVCDTDKCDPRVEPTGKHKILIRRS